MGLAGGFLSGLVFVVRGGARYRDLLPACLCALVLGVPDHGGGEAGRVTGTYSFNANGDVTQPPVSYYYVLNNSWTFWQNG